MPNVLTWKDNSRREEGYRIYRHTEPFDNDTLPPVYTTLPENSTSFTDVDVLPGVTYYYRIAAFKADKLALSPLILIQSGTGLGPAYITNGDYALGYFGQATAQEVSTYDGLSDALFIYKGLVPTESDWLKFSIDEKILLVSKRPIRSGISWNELYQEGVVYGDKVLALGGYQYKVRLMRGALSDPASFSVSDGTGLDDSEWSKLIYRVSVNCPAGITPWESFSDTDLGLGSSVLKGYQTLCLEKMSSDISKRVIRGTSGQPLKGSGSVSADQISETNGWRVVLELVRNPTLITIDKVESSVIGLMPLGDFQVSPSLPLLPPTIDLAYAVLEAGD